MKYEDIEMSPLSGIEINLGEELLIEKLLKPNMRENDNIIYSDENGFCKSKEDLIILREWINKIILYSEEVNRKHVNVIEAFEHMRKGKVGYFDNIAYTIINGDLVPFGLLGDVSKREITQEMINREWEID